MVSAFLRSFVLAVHCADVDRFGLLRLVRMLGMGIDAQICKLTAAERSARQHALHGLFDDALGKVAGEDRLAVRSLRPPI